MADQFKIENYLPNSFILIEGKRDAHNFYIIKSGKVKVSRANPVMAEEPSSILGPGDFFGVISCMSGQARIDTSQATENVSLISVEKELFGTLIQKNPAVAMKIIRFFSKKLRLFDHAIANITFTKTTPDTPSNLFNIGEYYLKKKAANNAVYAYQRYIQYCPNGEKVDTAIARLQSLKAPLKTPENPDMQFTTRIYRDNAIIFCECEPGNELFIIQSGKVKITKIIDEEVLLAVLKPGDIFGEMALLDDSPRSASAISFGDSQMIAVNRHNFESMVQKQPLMTTRLIQLLSERIWTAYRQLENLMINNDVGRLYDMLLIQVEKQKIPILPKTPHNF
ncbi:MAG: cyclic nucleotide-binding domain-containing protein, partial [Spirochaetia bacterium]|nr:cyclic nucleotide-binding domain-containing protein [Spirochaetia bacterium]